MSATHRPRGPSTDAAMLHENLIIAKSGPTRIRMMAASYKDASGRGLMVCPHLSQTPRLVPSSSFSMPRKRRVLSLPQKLPPCDGPKLNIFPYHKSRIQWLERLDEDDDVTSSQGYVFRALIRGREYAVKVFKFFDPMSTEYFWGPLLGEDTSLDTAAYYTDPFYAECRAYGRIREGTDRRILKSDVAVASHGFFFLESKDQEALQNRNIDLGLDSVDINYQRSTIGGLRARAIVKDVASPESGITSTNMRRILGKLVSMNKAGIYNMDIRIDNFRDGRLVDFGSSWTEPHALLGSLSYEAATESKLADRVMFEQMIEDEELMNSGEVKAIHHMQLRSQVQRH